MIFEVTTSANSYECDYDTLNLRELGFDFKETQATKFNPKRWIIKEPITIEINTIKELMDFISLYGRIVLTEDSIEIYDNYRE